MISGARGWTDLAKGPDQGILLPAFAIGRRVLWPLLVPVVMRLLVGSRSPNRRGVMSATGDRYRAIGSPDGWTRY